MSDDFIACLRHSGILRGSQRLASLSEWNSLMSKNRRHNPETRSSSPEHIDFYRYSLLNPNYHSALKRLHRKRKYLNLIERHCVNIWLDECERVRIFSNSFLKDQCCCEIEALRALHKARQCNDFSIVTKPLNRVIKFKRKEANMLGYDDIPHASIFRYYEHDIKYKDFGEIICQLKNQLIPFYRKLHDQQSASRLFPLNRSRNKYKILRFFRSLLKDVIQKPSYYRIDFSDYASCYCIAPDDIRILIRYAGRDIRQSLLDLMHEIGHALYEYGFSKKLYCTPLAMTASYGIDEAFAKLWEVFIAQDKSFVNLYFPRFRKLFPNNLRGVNADTFHRTFSLVSPSPFSSELDELTYTLQLIMKCEIERDLINGAISVDHLAKVWIDKSYECFGLTPKDDNSGILKDWHWMDGRFGYFPSCLMGNIYAGHLWQMVLDNVPNVSNLIETGHFQSIIDLLSTRFCAYGKIHKPGKLIKIATGRNLDCKYFVNFLISKYSAS